MVRVSGASAPRALSARTYSCASVRGTLRDRYVHAVCIPWIHLMFLALVTTQQALAWMHLEQTPCSHGEHMPLRQEASTELGPTEWEPPLRDAKAEHSCMSCMYSPWPFDSRYA